jgi:polar amino acid transport system substrate-binding protein
VVAPGVVVSLVWVYYFSCEYCVTFIGAETASRRWYVLLLGVAALLAGAVSAVVLLRADGSLRRVRDTGVLKIGYAVEAPFSYLGPHQEVTGESAEAARKIAAQLGLARIEWVQTSFAQLIPDLLERRFDVIASGLVITPQRAALVSFSSPTSMLRPGVLVTAGNPLHVPPVVELAPSPGEPIAYVASSIVEDYLRGRGFSSDTLLAVPDPAAGVAAVQAGMARGFVLSLPSLRWMSSAHPGELQVLDGQGAVGNGLGSVPIAYAFRPEDRALRDAWDAVQRRYIASAEHISVAATFGISHDDILGAPPAPSNTP